MGLALINEVLNSYEYQEKYKILEQEIYKLLISNCKNITDFNWFTTLPLYQYPGASTFFSQLRTLDIECNQSLASEKLLGMAQICQNIENLKICNNENGDVHDNEIICDEVLNVLSNYSSKTFEEFSFNSNWYFSVNGLQNFFESWRGKKPIKFVTHFDKCRQFTEEHIKIVKKYYDEGVIDKETKYLFGVK
ncbi:unnamed protein product [Rhizophagus irregularis]|nr:unnamed protein product [Rhizophagus irregularis]